MAGSVVQNPDIQIALNLITLCVRIAERKEAKNKFRVQNPNYSRERRYHDQGR
jgi:hypothetical protein